MFDVFNHTHPKPKKGGAIYSQTFQKKRERVQKREKAYELAGLTAIFHEKLEHEKWKRKQPWPSIITEYVFPTWLELADVKAAGAEAKEDGTVGSVLWFRLHPDDSS